VEIFLWRFIWYQTQRKARIVLQLQERRRIASREPDSSHPPSKSFWNRIGSGMCQPMEAEARVRRSSEKLEADLLAFLGVKMVDRHVTPDGEAKGGRKPCAWRRGGIERWWEKAVDEIT